SVKPTLIGVVSVVPAAPTDDAPPLDPLVPAAVVPLLPATTVVDGPASASPLPPAVSSLPAETPDAEPALSGAASRGLSTSIGTIRPATSIPATTPVSVWTADQRRRSGVAGSGSTLDALPEVRDVVAHGGEDRVGRLRWEVP